MDSYYHSHDLGKFGEMGKGNKELWDKFMSYYGAVFAEGALTEREKSLIALAVAHAVQADATPMALQWIEQCAMKLVELGTLSVGSRIDVRHFHLLGLGEPLVDVTASREVDFGGCL